MLDEGITESLAEQLLAAWNDEDGRHFGLTVRAASYQAHERGGFTYRGIVKDLLTVPLAGDCDRILFFVGRDWRDTLFWFVPKLYEVRGGIDALDRADVAASAARRG